MDSKRSLSDSTNTTSRLSDCTQNAVVVPDSSRPSSSQHDDVYSTENIILNHEQELWGKIYHLRDKLQKAEQETKTLWGKNDRLLSQVQKCEQEIKELTVENVQLHNQVHLRKSEQVINARKEEQLKKLLHNAQYQLYAAGSVVQSQELNIATRDETIRLLRHQLQQTTLLQNESENIRNHVQQIASWVIPREEVFIRENDILGQGGQGVVYKGTFRCTPVAVKQLHQLSPKHRKLFEREMNIMSQCHHPNLVQLIGATNGQGSPLLVIERLHCSLRGLIEYNNGCGSQLDKNLIIILAFGLAKGLCYLHGKTPPIIHRDLKSDNVLLEKHADSWKPKLSDYGTANFCSDDMTPNRGTVIYAAPEAWTANLQTTKMDVYSFGWLVYEMCTGNRPGPRNLIQQQIELISSTALKELVYACIQDNPVQRPTMEEVTNFLMKGLGNTNA